MLEKLEVCFDKFEVIERENAVFCGISIDP
jgi:hypothetical protein